MKYYLVVRCENGHLTRDRILRPVIEDGVLKSGLLGSGSDFCWECDAMIVEDVEVISV